MSYKVSIIIPFYSNVVWLEEAVNSVLSQTNKCFEIILVNDGSKEDMRVFIEKYGDQVNYYKTVNKGPGHARNYGISKANGEYIAFLDSDDLWLPNKLDYQLKEMETNKWVWSHCSYSLFNDKNGKFIKNVLVGNFKGNIFIKKFISSPIATPCVMVKRSFFFQNPTARFSEELRYGQDSYLWGIISETYPLGAIDDVLVKVRIRGTNAGRRARIQLQTRANTWKEIYNKRNKNDPRFLNLHWFPLLLFRLSFSLNRIVCVLEKINKLNSNSAELLSKVLYAPIYIVFKIYNITLK